MEALRPEATNCPSSRHGCLRTGLARGHVRLHASTQSFVFPEDLTPSGQSNYHLGTVSLKHRTALEHTMKNVTSSYRVFRKSRHFRPEQRAESGGGTQTAFVLRSFLEPAVQLRHTSPKASLNI